MKKYAGFLGILIISVILLIAGINWLTSDDKSDGKEGRNSGKSGSSPFKDLAMVPPDEALADYKESSKYPPNSRPLSYENKDLLHPNQRFETPLRLDDNSDFFYLFTADKFRIIGKDEIVFKLHVQRGEHGSQKEKLAIDEAYIKKGADPSTAKRVYNLNFSQPQYNSSTGDANPGSFSSEFNPSKIFPSENRAANYFAYIKFRSNGETVKAEIAFEYFPENTIPARFTGVISDELKQGSLYINAEIDVKNKGFYVVDANLYDSQGKPVSYTVTKLELNEGRSIVPLLFFGKVLSDSEANPPYMMHQLRGYRFIEVKEPDAELMDREIIPEYEKEYHTRRYYKSDFSSKEYDSEEKRKKMEFLEEQVKNSR